MIHCQIYFFGRVQGVGFRYTAYSLAKQFAVSGFVRNRPNGSVEIVVEGTAGEIDHFLDSLHNEMDEFIEDEESAESPVTGEFDGFEIR